MGAVAGQISSSPLQLYLPRNFSLECSENCSLCSFPAQIRDSIRYWLFSLGCETASTIQNRFQLGAEQQAEKCMAWAAGHGWLCFWDKCRNATGTGLLENVGVATPWPRVALAVTVLVGVLTAVFIFQAAPES